MTTSRLNRIKSLSAQLEVIKSTMEGQIERFDSLSDEERDAHKKLPEDLQLADVGLDMKDNVTILNSVACELVDLTNSLEGILSKLKDLKK